MRRARPQLPLTGDVPTCKGKRHRHRDGSARFYCCACASALSSRHHAVSPATPPKATRKPVSVAGTATFAGHGVPHTAPLRPATLHARNHRPALAHALRAARFETLPPPPSLFIYDAPFPTSRTTRRTHHSTPRLPQRRRRTRPLRPPSHNGASPSRPRGPPPRRAAPARALSRAGARPPSPARTRAQAGARSRSPAPARAGAWSRSRGAAGRSRVVLRPRHLLRRGRRVRNHGRRVRVRQPVQPGVRHQHGGAEHGALQQRPQLRGVLRGALRRGRRRLPLLPARHRRRHGHQLLPAKQRAALRRRRVVQPAARALRHGAARLPAHRALQGRHCARLLPQGGVQQEGRHPVHHQRPLLLQPRPRHQRRRIRRRARGVRQGRALRVAGHVPQLGPELAEQRAPGPPGALFPRHHRRRPLRRLQQRRSPRLVVRPDLQRRAVLRHLRCLSKHRRTSSSRQRSY